MVRLDCGKACRQRQVLGWALNPGGMGRFRKLAGSEFQTDGAIKPKERSLTEFRFRVGIFKAARSRVGGYMMSHMCRAKTKGKTGVYLRSDCKLELRSGFAAQFHRQPMEHNYQFTKYIMMILGSVENCIKFYCNLALLGLPWKTTDSSR